MGLLNRIARLPGPGETLGERFQLVREVGRGAVGAIFEATDKSNGQRVAIKVLLPEVLGDPTVVERFKREAQFVAELTHPNTVRIFGFGAFGESEGVTGLPYIAMEYLAGEDLGQWLDRQGTMPLGQSLAVIQQALASLAEAHERRIIHRDIKPDNIFLSGGPGQVATVKVLDFGIARALEEEVKAETPRLERLTETGMVCGTPQFMAPEQAEGRRDLTPAVDVYTVACVLYEMITGLPLYEGYTPYQVAYMHVTAPLPEFPPDLAASSVGAMLRHALAKQPQDRYQDASAFAATLAQVIEGLDIEVVPPVLPGEPVPEAPEADEVFFDDDEFAATKAMPMPDFSALDASESPSVDTLDVPEEAREPWPAPDPQPAPVAPAPLAMPTTPPPNPETRSPGRKPIMILVAALGVLATLTLAMVAAGVWWFLSA